MDCVIRHASNRDISDVQKSAKRCGFFKNLYWKIDTKTVE